ncbi:MAG: hypothetical protein EHM18_17625 [Acidobacteria bacterium]|nr:MAG: hypothetical protein EHM18_17625 [Acidobacteriota bacterium]
MFRGDRPFASLLAAGLLLSLSACSRTSDTSTAIRLVDTFRPEMVKGTPASVGQVPSLALWDFTHPPEAKPAEEPATLGWKAGVGVSGLALRDGRLVGRSTDEVPIIYVTPKIENDDQIYAVEIRMRADKGANVRVSGLTKPEPPDFKQIVPMTRGFPWPDTTPLLAGDQFQTYTIQIARPTSSANFITSCCDRLMPPGQSSRLNRFDLFPGASTWLAFLPASAGRVWPRSTVKRWSRAARRQSKSRSMRAAIPGSI